MNSGKPMNITVTWQRNDEPPVQEMVVNHRIFRREFRLLADLVRRVPAGNYGLGPSRGPQWRRGSIRFNGVASSVIMTVLLGWFRVTGAWCVCRGVG